MSKGLKDYTPKLLAVLALACLLAAGIFQVRAKKESLELSYELGALERQKRLGRERVRKLRLELDLERSPKRLKELAQLLGMSVPRPDQLWIVGAELSIEDNNKNRDLGALKDAISILAVSERR